MEERSCSMAASLGPIERDYIRHELGGYFGTLPSVHDGFYLRSWKSGPKAGQPRLPRAAEMLVSKGLMEIRTTDLGPRAFFTPAGLEELRRAAADPRYFDPERYRHVLVELGLNGRAA
jgi:hypothetical protein